VPKIYLPPKKVYKRVRETDKRENINHKAVYNTKRWRQIRIEKLKQDPLCEECLSKKIITPGVEVHHIKPVSSGKTIKDKQALGFDKSNLKTLCQTCHKQTHNDNNRKGYIYSTEY